MPKHCCCPTASSGEPASITSISLIDGDLTQRIHYQHPPVCGGIPHFGDSGAKARYVQDRDDITASL
jgi:hypothetical protein